MTYENSIVLATGTFGAIYLCATSLQQINKYTYNPLTFPYNPLAFYCNYFIFGLSSGMIITLTRHIIKNNN